MSWVPVSAIDGQWYISVACTHTFQSVQETTCDDRPCIVSTVKFGECEVRAMSVLCEIRTSRSESHPVLRVLSNDCVAWITAALKGCTAQVNGDRVVISKDVGGVEQPIGWVTVAGQKAVASVVDIRLVLIVKELHIHIVIAYKRRCRRRACELSDNSSGDKTALAGSNLLHPILG
jgi:hypothetical protein